MLILFLYNISGFNSEYARWLEMPMKSIACLSYASLLLCMLCLSVGCSGQDEEIVALMEKTEQEALYSAIQGFVGEWWNGFDLYPDPCGWTPIQGVSCDLFDGFWYVTSLNIGPIHDNSLDCGPNPEFRPQLFALRHLKSLSFFNCFVSPRLHSIAIPNENWEVFSCSLESLEFRSNPGLIGQIPTTFGELSGLQSLVLLENGLMGQLPTNIGNLINLRRLVLAANWFAGQIPHTYGGLKDLLIFDLSRNSLAGALPLTIGGLTSLLKLDLSNNRFEGKIPAELGNLKNLTLLDLSNNKFSGGLPKSLEQMSSLEELVLSNNLLGGGIMHLDWHKLRSLAVLDLSNMVLTGGIPDSLSELKRLRFVGLNDNNLTGDISPTLAALPNVSALYLNDNNLTGELKFSDTFYGKMGRRFGAWNNPNLCYPVGLISEGHAPFGVKACEREVTLCEKTKLGNQISNQTSYSIASLGHPRYGLDGLWCIFLAELSIIAAMLNTRS